jgi:hypothetical protein
MGVSRGEITTKIVKDGLIFNMDPANRASTIPVSTVETSFNTVNLSQSGSFSDNGIFDSSTITPSFAFGGTDDYIDTSQINPSSFSAYTYNVWLKTSTTSQQYVLGGASGNYSNKTTLSTRFDGSKGIRFITAGSDLYDTGNLNSHLGNWIQITITDAGGDDVAAYLNGVSQAITKAVDNGSYETNQKLNIARGMRNTGGFTGNYFSGNIGAVHIYNRALSANEVLQNYNGMKARFGL